jgi:hypothetical protein
VHGQPGVRAEEVALPSPRVGRMSRRATGGQRWMIVAATQVAVQNSAYRPARRLTVSLGKPVYVPARFRTRAVLPSSGLVRPEDVIGGARAAHRGARFEVAERQRESPIRVEARHFVNAAARIVDPTQAPKSAAPVSRRRMRSGYGRWFRDRLWQGHRSCRRPPKAGRLASNMGQRQGSKGTRLPGGGCLDRVAGVATDAQERAWTHATGPTAMGAWIGLCPIRMGRDYRVGAA